MAEFLKIQAHHHTNLINSFLQKYLRNNPKSLIVPSSANTQSFFTMHTLLHTQQRPQSPPTRRKTPPAYLKTPLLRPQVSQTHQHTQTPPTREGHGIISFY